MIRIFDPDMGGPGDRFGAGKLAFPNIALERFPIVSLLVSKRKTDRVPCLL
jgi:hypothetical protein